MVIRKKPLWPTRIDINFCWFENNQPPPSSPRPSSFWYQFFRLFIQQALRRVLSLWASQFKFYLDADKLLISCKLCAYYGYCVHRAYDFQTMHNQGGRNLCANCAINMHSVCRLCVISIETVWKLWANYVQIVGKLFANCVKSMCKLCEIYVQTVCKSMCKLCANCVQTVCKLCAICWREVGKVSKSESWNSTVRPNR